MRKHLKAMEAQTPNWATPIGKISRKSHGSEAECNICGGKYLRKNRFQRFCRTCKNESEIYRVAEWMPVA